MRYLLEGKTLDFDNDVTFLVGENGTGKSTLLEAVAVAYGFNPEGAPGISVFPPVPPIRLCTLI